MTLELVNHLLSTDIQDYEVVVVDHNSQDGLYERLLEIDDDRLHVYNNEIEDGAKQNWYEALEHGSGEWLFQIIDRDWINLEYIELLLLLQFMKIEKI